MLVPLLRKTAKLFIAAMGVLYVAATFDIELLPLLASFGIAGLAISFAAQDMVKNLFGGLTIFLDQPFRVGERINYKGFDGTVEEIGFRITRMRTLVGHLVTIPNGGITSEPVENITRRPSLRRIMNITITYDTPKEKIEQAVQIVRDIFEEPGIREPIHQYLNGELMAPRVFFNQFNSDSLNIFAIYWYIPPEWWPYNEHAHRVNLRIFEEFEKAGIEFAFPTQTLYLAGDPKRELAVRMLADQNPSDPRD
jgi:MscS family membrane protein